MGLVSALSLIFLVYGDVTGSSTSMIFSRVIYSDSLTFKSAIFTDFTGVLKFSSSSKVNLALISSFSI